MEQINMKNIHPMSSSWIRTHNLLIMTSIPNPLNQGTNPFCATFQKLTVRASFDSNRRLSLSHTILKRENVLTMYLVKMRIGYRQLDVVIWILLQGKESYLKYF